MNQKNFLWFFYASISIYIILGFTYANEINKNTNIYYVVLSHAVTFFLVVISAFNYKGNYTRYLVISNLLVGYMFVGLFNYLYYYHTGAFFEYTGSDSTMYHAESLKASKSGLIEGVSDFIKYTKYGISDAGMIVYQSFLYKIIGHPLFPRFINVLVNTITVIYLFKISKEFVSMKLAFITALIYGLSSYTIYFQSSGLKETIFIFFIVLSYYYYYKVIYEGQFRYFINLGLVIGILFFFRIPVTIFVLLSFALVEAFRMSYSVKKLALGVLVIISFLGFAIYNFEIIIWYFLREDQAIVSLYSGTFYQTLSLFAGFYGPLPTIIPAIGSEDVAMYGSGLIVKAFLSSYFIYAIYIVIKDKNHFLIAILVFCLLHIVSLIFLGRAFKVRYVIPYLPFFFLLSAYAFNNLQRGKRRMNFFIKKSIITGNFGIYILIIIWNVLRL